MTQRHLQKTTPRRNRRSRKQGTQLSPIAWVRFGTHIRFETDEIVQKVTPGLLDLRMPEKRRPSGCELVEIDQPAMKVRLTGFPTISTAVEAL